MAEMILRDAMAKALREALDTDERAFLMGEDIGAYGGPYAVTRGFLQDYGEERIRDTLAHVQLLEGGCPECRLVSGAQQHVFDRRVLHTHLRVVGRAEVAVLLDTPGSLHPEGVDA